MLQSGKMERGVFEIVDTESLVPANHLLRKIDAAVDFGKIYDMVEPLYCNAGNAVKHNPGIYQGTDCSCRKDG